MKRNRFTRAAAVVAAGALGAAGVLVLSATGAQAATIGSLSFTPTAGNQNNTITVQTSGPCPSGTNLIVNMTGSGLTNTGFPSGTGQIVVSRSSLGAYGTNGAGGYIVPLADTMQNFANLQSPVATLSGRYDFTLSCVNNVGSTSFGEFTGAIYFTSTSSWHASATTTTLAAPTQSAGATTASLSATVAGAAAPTGSVQFKVDGANSGSPVALSGGVANYVTPSLSVGGAGHTFQAVYVPASNEFDASSSAVSGALVITGVSTVALSANVGATIQPNTPITLTAATGPSGQAGAVNFQRNGTTIPGCGAVANPSDSAQCVYTPIAVETDAFTAVFTPTNTSYGASTSNTVTIAVQSSFTSEDIITKVTAQGSLVISVNGCSYSDAAKTQLTPADGPAQGPLAGASGTVGSTDNTLNPCNDVVLATPTLNGTGQLLTTSGSLKPVTITDSRIPDAPWSFTGQTTDFYDFNSVHSFPGSGLGWTPNGLTTNVNPTTGVRLGGTVAGDAGPFVFSATGGLKTAAPLAFTSLGGTNGTGGTAGSGTSPVPTGTGLGTTQVGAALTLNVPTNTVPGVYVAHLSLTAI